MKNGSLKQVIKGWANGWDDYTTTANGSLYRSNDVLYSYGDHFPLAVTVGQYSLVNADRYSKSTSKHQAYVIHELPARYTVEIPFSTLSEMINNTSFRIHNGYSFNPATLSDHLSILDTETDKWYPTGRFSPIDGHEYMTHVLGGTLFKYDDRYIYGGIDETGIGKARYFMTELVGAPETCREALESMKPQEVKDAESKGLEVLRQGEWFFVKDGLTVSKNDETLFKGKDPYFLKGNDGDTGHHFATHGDLVEGQQFVYGIVKHEERDHKQCKLYDDPKVKSWWQAYHNVQVKSFNSFGNVD